MSITINNNSKKYNLWLYGPDGVTPIGPNYDNIFIRQGIKNIFCIASQNRKSSSLPNGVGDSVYCDGESFVPSGLMNDPTLVAISKYYAIGTDHYWLVDGSSVYFWYRFLNNGSGGFINRNILNRKKFPLYNGIHSSDLVIYEFDIPLPDDMDFAFLPVFDDRDKWILNKNKFFKKSGLYVDQDSRLVPGYVEIFDYNPYIYEYEDINSGIDVSTFKYRFISDLNDISIESEKKVYLKFLEENNSYYDEIFRSIKTLNGDSSRPSFEVDLDSKIIILYGVATSSSNRYCTWTKSLDNYDCGAWGVTGSLVSTSFFGINHRANESDGSLVLGSELASKDNKFLLKYIDTDYMNNFLIGVDSISPISFGDYESFDADMDFLHKKSTKLYFTVEGGFRPEDFDGSACFPKGNLIDVNLRNTLNVNGTINYLNDKYGGIWNQEGSIVILNIIDKNYGGDYGVFNLIQDFYYPLSSKGNNDFMEKVMSSKHKKAKDSIISYIYDLKKKMPGIKLSWHNLINFDRYSVLRIDDIISDSDMLWEEISDRKKQVLFNKMDVIFSGVIELLDFINFDVFDNYNKNDINHSENHTFRVNLLIEYVKGYFYRNQSIVPLIIPSCDATAGYAYGVSCEFTSIENNQRFRPLPDNKFIKNQIVPIIKNNCDGILMWNNGILDKLYKAYYSGDEPGNISERNFIRRNYVCSDPVDVNLSDCAYYNDPPAICSSFGTSSIPDRLGVSWIIKSYLLNKLSLIFKQCLNYESNINSKTSLLFSKNINPWNERYNYEFLNHIDFNGYVYDVNTINKNFNMHILNDFKISNSSFMYTYIYESGINWNPDNYLNSTYSFSKSYITGDVVRFFVDEINKWVVFRAVSNVAVNNYPGKSNYFSDIDNSYLYTNIGVYWEARDSYFLHDHFSRIKIISKTFSSNHDDIYEHIGNKKYYISSDYNKVMNLPLYEYSCFLFHNQGDLISIGNLNNYNYLGNFNTYSSSDNYGFAHKILEDDSYPLDFFTSYGQLVENNVGLISDYIYWYKYVAEDELKLNYSTSQIENFILNYDLSYGQAGFEQYSYPFDNIGVLSSGFLNGITRYQIFNFIKTYFNDIKECVSKNVTYYTNSECIDFDCGVFNIKNLHSRGKNFNDVHMIDCLKKNLEKYSSIYSWSPYGYKIASNINNLTYYRVLTYPKNILVSGVGIYDSNYDNSHGLSLFIKNNNNLNFIGNSYENIYSSKSSILKFKVVNKQDQYMELLCTSDDSEFLNGLGVSSLYLKVDGYYSSSSWLCSLEFNFVNQDSFNYFKNNFYNLYINRLHGYLNSEDAIFASRWQIYRNNFSWESTNPVNSYSPSSLFYLLDQDNIDNFIINSYINVNLSLWGSGSIYSIDSLYSYSSKTLSDISFTNSEYDTGFSNISLLTYDGSSHKILQHNYKHNDMSYIKNYLDLNHYESIKKYFTIIGDDFCDILNVKIKCPIFPLWMSKYGLENPKVRCNNRYFYKNNSYNDSSSYYYSGFETHEYYGVEKNSQTFYESYGKSVESFLKISKSYRPNKQIMPSFYLRNFSDEKFLSCFYHPKEFSYYLVRPWLLNNYTSSVNICENIKDNMEQLFYNSSNETELNGIRNGLYMAIFNGYVPGLEESEFSTSSNFDWDYMDRGGMLWELYGESAMSYLGYTSVNGIDSNFNNKKKIEILIKKIIDLYLRDIIYELKLLSEDPLNYPRPSDIEIGYGKVRFLNGILLSSNNELKIEFIGSNSYSSQNWAKWSVEWYKSFSYLDDPSGFESIYTQTGSGYTQFIYGPNELIDKFSNGDILKIKLTVDNNHGVNYGFSYTEEFYFEAQPSENSLIFVPSQKMISRNQNVIKII